MTQSFVASGLISTFRRHSPCSAELADLVALWSLSPTMMRPIACRRACVRLYSSNHLRTHMRSFASVVTGNEEGPVGRRYEKSLSPEETRRDIRQLLHKIKQRQIADDVAGLQAKFNLINLVNRKASSENGPLASDTLETVAPLPAVQNDSPLAGKLHCLVRTCFVTRILSPLEALF